MARKKEPYMVFETKEEFDRMWEEQVTRASREGRAEGFKDGCVWLMSYIEELFQDLFKAETFNRVQNEIRTRQIEEWRKDKCVKSRKERLDEAWGGKLMWNMDDGRE